MYVKVLFDNAAKKGMLSGWGFSCLVEGKILFDTGESAEALAENMKRMMVSVPDIEGVVISHDRWDHTGGLWALLKQKKGLKVYACPSFSNTFKDCVKELGGELILTEEPTQITEGIWVSGEIRGAYKDQPVTEQALIIKGDKGTSVLTGCARIGIVDTLVHVKKILSIELSSFYSIVKKY